MTSGFAGSAPSTCLADLCASSTSTIADRAATLRKKRSVTLGPTVARRGSARPCRFPGVTRAVFLIDHASR